MKNEKQLKKYLKNAYKVYSGQKPCAVVAELDEEIAALFKLPKDIIVCQPFFEKMKAEHREMRIADLFSFVATLNVPDTLCKRSASNLNFFRALDSQMTNLVGTLYRDDQQVVTSFHTSKRRYLNKIKKTAIAIFERNTGGALTTSSLILSPPAGALPEGISGVNVSDLNISNSANFINVRRKK